MAKKSGKDQVRSGARKRPRAEVNRESGANPARAAVSRKGASRTKGR